VHPGCEVEHRLTVPSARITRRGDARSRCVTDTRRTGGATDHATSYFCLTRAQDLPVASRTGDVVPVTHAERSSTLTVTRTRSATDEAILAAHAARSGDLTRLLELRRRRVG
jgi:hypothetical protein